MSPEDELARRRRRDETVIQAHPDGPFLVRGQVTVLDGSGEVVALRRRVVALCRCGRSRNQPLCDGMHAPAGFECSAVHDGPSSPSARSTPSRPG